MMPQEAEEYRGWLKSEIQKLKIIKEELKGSFGVLNFEEVSLLFRDGQEPWGLRNKQNGRPASQQGQNGTREITLKQKNEIQKHLSGKRGKDVGKLIHSTGKSLEALTMQEAHEIISKIYSWNGEEGGVKHD